MSHRNLKVINSPENRAILNTSSAWKSTAENSKAIEIEFETDYDCAEMQVKLAQSSNPYPH